MIPKEHYILCDVTRPVGIVQTRQNIWVWCEGGDLRKTVLYKGVRKNTIYGSLQGNANKEIALGFKPYDGCELVFAEQCFIPWEDE